jgi:hypothetical protein
VYDGPNVQAAALMEESDDSDADSDNSAKKQRKTAMDLDDEDSEVDEDFKADEASDVAEVRSRAPVYEALQPSRRNSTVGPTLTRMTGTNAPRTENYSSPDSDDDGAKAKKSKKSKATTDDNDRPKKKAKKSKSDAATSSP